MSTKIHKLIILNLFSKLKFLGCYNSTPLKMNLVLEIQKMVITEIQILCLWILLFFLV